MSRVPLASLVPCGAGVRRRERRYDAVMGLDDPAGPGGDSDAAGATPAPGEENLDEPPVRR